MYQIIVCDDNREFTDALVMLLSRYADYYSVEVVGFSNGHDVLEYCQNNRCDIIYMDIEVGADNGMSIAKALKRIYPHMLTIYISAYDNYYTDMVQAEPFRFISKDMSDMQRFEKAVADTLEAAMHRITGNGLWTYEFRRKQYTIELGKVRYFHSFARTIYIVGDIGEAPCYYYGNFSELQRVLEKLNSNFIRVNKSYIANMKYVRYLGKDKVQIDDVILSLSPMYHDKFCGKYMECWQTRF